MTLIVRLLSAIYGHLKSIIVINVSVLDIIELFLLLLSTSCRTAQRIISNVQTTHDLQSACILI